MESFDINIPNELSEDSCVLDISFNKDKEIIRKFSDSLDSLSFIFDYPPITTKKQKKKKINKQILSIMPMPIFECIYCANESIASKHLVSQILGEKYGNDMDSDDNVKNKLFKEILKLEIRHLNKEGEYIEATKTNILNRKRNRNKEMR